MVEGERHEKKKRNGEIHPAPAFVCYSIHNQITSFLPLQVGL